MPHALEKLVDRVVFGVQRLLFSDGAADVASKAIKKNLFYSLILSICTSILSHNSRKKEIVMVHPDTELRFINHLKGLGVFAIKPIPKGTLTYVMDDLEVVIEPGDKRLSDPRYRKLIDTYSFMDRDGKRIISWDHAKYVNHCCQCNTMSTGYGFEITIRDIAAGEEITDEYSMFNFSGCLQLHCDKSPCRESITSDDLKLYHKEWDEMVKSALDQFQNVDQPLSPFLGRETEALLNEYLQNGNHYISVLELACERL